MHQTKSWRCRSVDQDLGRFAQFGRKRHYGVSGACQGRLHRTKKEKKNMSHFEIFVTEGNEMADEMANAGAMLDKGSKGTRKGNYCSARETRGVRSFTVCSQLSLLGRGMERL